MIDLKAIRAAAEADKGQDRAFILLSVDILALLDRLEAAEKALAEPAPAPLLSDEEIGAMWVTAHDGFRVPHAAFARAIEQLVRRKAGL